MARFQYLILMGLCVLITLPLEFVFPARVWRPPPRLAIALVPANATGGSRSSFSAGNSIVLSPTSS